MQMKWHIITLAILLITVSCSKEKQTMSNGLVIEDIKIGKAKRLKNLIS
ncbi:MAG: hypothetical protein Ct9H90mP20_5010 [Candidatus Neomarinimicrobiota bacterium]|nr:MAG: hypothetical protein Ct9H90mP20_5010 [Candidatus Neomarinimicrobiota bacterium]